MHGSFSRRYPRILFVGILISIFGCSPAVDTPQPASPPTTSVSAAPPQHPSVPNFRPDYTLAASNANASFEEAAPHTLPGWATSSSGAGAWAITGDQARTGARALRLDGQNILRQARLDSAPVPVQGGDMIEYQCWVMAQGSNTISPAAWMEMDAGDGRWAPLEPRATGPDTRPDQFHIEWSWQPRGGCLILPKEARRVRMVVACSTENATRSSWYLDDAAFHVVSYKEYARKQSGAPALEDFTMMLVDTLAADRLDGYGFSRGHTPNLRLLASEGTLYENTVTAAPWTRPSIASIFTSRYPSQHTAELLNSPIPDRFTTLAESMKARGYFTAAFVRTYFDGFIGPGTGFGQGFDLYYYSVDEDAVFAAAKAFLDLNQEALRQHKGGIFLLFHFFEPHSSYQNHVPAFLENKGTMGPLLMNETIDAIVNRGEDPDQTNHADMEYARACYDSEVYFMDQRIGDILFRFKQMDLYERMNILFTADHGEALGERPMIWNHGNPHGSTTQVPLIIRFPGRTKAAHRDTRQVSTLDVLPTLLTAAGAALPEGCEGFDLLDPTKSAGHPYTVSEDKSRGLAGNGSLALREGNYKLAVWDASQRMDPKDWTSSEWIAFRENTPSRFELFDLAKDPYERVDISKENPDIFEHLKKLLYEHARRTGMLDPQAGKADTPALSEETIQDLEAIGYLSPNEIESK